MPVYTPEAEALARVLWPHFAGNLDPSALAVAQRAIDAGWTPPDPHLELARAISAAIYPGDTFNLSEDSFDARLLAAVRRLDLVRRDGPSTQ